MILQTSAQAGRTTFIEEREYLFFSGFSYLGMHVLPAFIQALSEGLLRYGAIFPSSRVANLRLRLYEELEHALAIKTGQQAAVTFSSGYLASQAAATYAQTQGALLYAPQTHPALQISKVSIPHVPREEWIAHTIEQVNAGGDHHYVILADAVNPLTGTIYDFSWLQQLERKVLVVIDDSHGFGVIGREGNGIAGMLPVHGSLRYLIVASLAKAHSVEGGMIAGHASDIATLRKLPCYTASTGVAPPYAHAYLESRSLFDRQRQSLQLKIDHFAQLIAGISFIHQPQRLPMFILEGHADIADFLQQHDILISSFAYPDPSGALINRVVLSALHTSEDLELLSRIIRHYQVSC
ncbi:aminotransferase class I/II-fold pyridoxal phosphate-dependent enzyme [Chitinophaga pendula]|uniref:aminotransferase class I/II-fold pyridoxal phosphate-dependent enzyme n=1 Tax=Chitinophaga TaxID=79328 RepID=UPI000BAE6F9D|nr:MULTISPECIES: aminotransferase class I/II-fold pyridoxal phosphate-dependent enzyme [Chitinophaga]ASZ12034.1 hypothetical protein CK934_14220 [Chitinophaga sp. MD30]UCJ04933.1 aminotransferase class I/II-fold pyridoxal phosphate-dependent enzyme [Chitinophaga pendula]